MSMDKIIAVKIDQVANGANSTWVMNETVILDNTAGVIPKTINSIMVSQQVFPDASNKAYFCMLYVTPQNGVVPAFGGSDDSNINTMLMAYRDNVWTTQSGVVKFGASIADDELVSFEPKTGRKLEPGQKLVLITLARNHANTTAGNLCFVADWNVWFTY